MPETTPLIKAALNLRGGAGFDVYIISRIAAFCGLSFLLAIKITSKLSNFILHQFGGLHKLWDTPAGSKTCGFYSNSQSLV